MKYFEKEKIHLFLCSASSVRAHDHPFLELAYVTSGEAEHIANGQTTTVRRGDYFVIDYRIQHSYTRVSEEVFTVINCLFLPEFIDNTLRMCNGFEELTHHYLIRMQTPLLAGEAFPYLFHDESGEIYRLLTRMMQEYAEKQAGYVELLRCDLISLLVLSLRALTATEEGDGDETRQICAYIAEHYGERLTLTELAARAHYSVPYFCQKFRRDTGLGFTEYLEKVRTAEACRLLANTNERILDVAARVGYRDGDSFLRMFRRNCGMSPAAYRARMRAK